MMEKMEYQNYKDNVFFLHEEKLDKGKKYGIWEISQQEFLGLYAGITELLNIFSGSKDILRRIQKNYYPRFSEINDFIWSNKEFPECLRIQISKKTRDDLLYALERTAVVTNLKSNQIETQNIRTKLNKIKLEKYKG